jgi:hypothetical protein
MKTTIDETQQGVREERDKERKRKRTEGAAAAAYWTTQWEKSVSCVEPRLNGNREEKESKGGKIFINIDFWSVMCGSPFGMCSSIVKQTFHQESFLRPGEKRILIGQMHSVVCRTHRSRE